MTEKGFMHHVSVAITMPDPEVLEAIRAQEKAIAQALAAQAKVLHEHMAGGMVFGSRFDPVRYETFVRRAAVACSIEGSVCDYERNDTEESEQRRSVPSIVDVLEL